ncbi:metallophosphoesterase [Allochromatium vinosum]|uniref:metallophosphoesterase n=1 Tax=Allochromatium vinosum TaxID=1049 RepID=UPI001904E7DC|nr:metallophosphoesterase [Allochromatium vinosum]MBK1653597.1 metallophosphoesterase [Allochromatium vinosum]
MAKPKRLARKSLLKRFRELLQGMDACEDVDLKDALRLGGDKIRVPAPALPLSIRLGGEDGYPLHLYPEPRFEEDGTLMYSGDYLLVDPDSYFQDISGFLRLDQGETLTLGRGDPLQRLLLRYPKSVAERHLRLKLSAKGLAFKNKSEQAGVCLAPLTQEGWIERLAQQRLRALDRLVEALGGPIEPLESSAALTLIDEVNALMRDEPYRVPNAQGRNSGLLALPDRPRPIFVGDLHARLDNLLVILTQGAFLDALIDGSALLILLGDAVQSDAPGQEAEMDSSMLMMDLIFRLKRRFPERVFYLRGNHDSFSDELSKSGVPQGLLWEQALIEGRGMRYRDAMQTFYDRLPYVAASSGYLACHAGPPLGKLSWEALVDIERHPKLAHQLTHVRLRQSGRANGYGYGPGDLARLRKRLGVKREAPVIVGHTPPRHTQTCWMNAGGIPNHHIVYGSHPDWIGVITRPEKRLVPLIYPSEPMLGVYNRRARAAQSSEGTHG